MEHDEEYFLEEDKLGMTVTAGCVTLPKNESNLIGISIGGGGKYCPCLYVVQVFDNTAASRDATLQSGDEIVGVNNVNVKGKSKNEVAQLIQRSEGSVTIQYNKLHPEPKQGKTLDIALKKVKHRLVESMSSSTADALGLSRAILCNDALVKKLDDLDKTESMYRSLIDHARSVFKAFFELTQVYKRFGDIFCNIGVREIQQSANEAFNQFGEAHRTMEKYGIHLIKKLKPILGDLSTYLHKAIPDTRLTIKRYADAKFEYLSYCLKVKEMDDEEIQFSQLQEPLYRVETGNYEYRLILRCRQEARALFARLRNDVMVKLELLDSKHVQHLTQQLTRLVALLAEHHTHCQQLMHDKHWFPIELDLSGTTLWNADVNVSRVQEYHDDDEEEAQEYTDEFDENMLGAVEATEDLISSGADRRVPSNGQQLLQGFEELHIGTHQTPNTQSSGDAFELADFFKDFTGRSAGSDGTTRGLSTLSQSLLSEPSIDKQLECFMSPSNSKNSSTSGTSEKLLGTLYGLESFLSSASTAVSDVDVTNAQNSATPVNNRIDTEDLVNDELEDVNLLDTF